jgi:hypothetical protein
MRTPFCSGDFIARQEGVFFVIFIESPQQTTSFMRLTAKQLYPSEQNRRFSTK